MAALAARRTYRETVPQSICSALANPLRTVNVAPTNIPPDDSSDWLYNSTTGDLRTNSNAASPSGTPLVEF